MNQFAYVGSELDLFAKATRWKEYWRSHACRYIHGSVLEVGAGNGNNTRLFSGVKFDRWVCIDPDVELCEQLRLDNAITEADVVAGTLADLPATERFDSILYFDVLEHIAEDDSELRLAMTHLKANGYLVILSPAYQWLYSPFDRAIGHYRRYSRRTLCAAVPAGMSRVLVQYLDSAGLIASLGNRFLLKSSMPTETQVLFWDKRLIPLSRYLDRIIGYRIGKSILGVWQKISRT